MKCPAIIFLIKDTVPLISAPSPHFHVALHFHVHEPHSPNIWMISNDEMKQGYKWALDLYFNVYDLQVVGHQSQHPPKCDWWKNKLIRLNSSLSVIDAMIDLDCSSVLVYLSILNEGSGLKVCQIYNAFSEEKQILCTPRSLSKTWLPTRNTVRVMKFIIYYTCWVVTIDWQKSFSLDLLTLAISSAWNFENKLFWTQ